jgi:hypothetical protein
MNRTLLLAATLAALALPATSQAQYSSFAGVNAPTERARVQLRDEKGRVSFQEVEREVAKDSYGNADGNRFDLAVDGAFEGQTITVLQFYSFPFEQARDALREKGFSVYRFNGEAPSPKALKEALAKSCQLWLISGDVQLLGKAHLKVIREFFEAGHGVYVWGDNDPYYADANYVAEALIGARMLGNLQGDRTVGLQGDPGKRGLRRGHLLTTGLEHLYEGITIATIQPNDTLTPLVYGSAGNLVAAVYERDGKRVILDGGFTRLYNKWDTAGTGRYVKNAAAWLAHAERFGDEVLAQRGDGGAKSR